MADYFPLISRAVSTLDPNTRERREAIYARARDALDRQLLALDPPIATVDLARERSALNETIRKVEAQFAAPPPPVLPQPSRPVAPPMETAPALPPLAPALPRAAEPQPASPAAPEPPRLIDPTADGAPIPPPRPKVTGGPTRGFAGPRGRIMMLAIAIPAMLVFGALAYALRDDPGRYLGQPRSVAENNDPQSQQRKSEGRLDGTGASPGAPASGPRPPAPPPQPQALPVAARVLFFEETGSDPRGAQSDGQVVWLLERRPAAGGRPAEAVLRGTVSVPKANMSFDLVFKRNREGGLPASHTVEVIFRPEGGRDGVKVIGPIQARDQETSPGYALKGAMVPVDTNLFLIGLDNNDLAIARNLEALREQKWFAFQFQMTNDKLGAALIEKGATGDRVFREALEAWK